MDGEVISTTGEHPFWVPDLGWVEAKDLVVGSLLQTEDGRIVDVDRVEKREGPFEVYNFNVEGIPTYFVSELGILVHNTCNPPIRLEDVTNGPHGPDRPISDLVARAIKDGKPQGRWTSRELAEKAISDANLDLSKMEMHKPYSVDIPEGVGEIVRLYDEYPPSNLPQSQRYYTTPADRAVVIRKPDGLHTYPIGPKHRNYNDIAPTL